MADESESLTKHGSDPKAMVEVGMVFEGAHVVHAVPRATWLEPCGTTMVDPCTEWENSTILAMLSLGTKN